MKQLIKTIETISQNYSNIDNKINQLLSLSDEFIFPAYYSHTEKTTWKISNVYTDYGEETFVLCGVDEGIEKAIDLAIVYISKAKEKFFDKNFTSNV